MVPDGRRRGRWLPGLVALAAAAALGGWLWGWSATPGPSAAGRSVPMSTAAGGPAAQPDAPAAGRTLATAPAPRVAPPLPPGWLEVCGEAPEPPVPAASRPEPGSDPEPPSPREQAILEESRALYRRMGEHADPAIRTTGLALETLRSQGDWMMCERPEGCAVPRDDHHRAMTRLVAAATGSPRSAAYALALGLCSGSPEPAPACRQVSAAEWARHDGDNLAAWHRVLMEARDPAAQAEALHRLTLATRNDTYETVLFEALSRALLPDAPPRLQAQAWAEAFALWSARLLPFPHAETVCSPAQLADPNRRAQCDAWARQLVALRPSLLDLARAQVLARRLGWPEAELAALGHARSLAYAASALEVWQRTLVQPLACSTLALTRAHGAAVGRLGEVGALQAMLAAAPEQQRARALDQQLRQEAGQRERMRQEETRRAAVVPPAASAPSDPPAPPRRDIP